MQKGEAVSEGNLRAQPVQAATAGGTPVLSSGILLLMAIACGLCAGANYFNQPLLNSIARSFGVSESTSSITVTIAQVSYGVGLFLLVPLGDMLARRRLAVVMMLLAAAGLFLSGFSASFAWLAVGTLLTGLFSVAAQVLVPMAAALAAPGASGRAVGLVMSGLLMGILLARSVAGVLSEAGGWQLVYRVGGVAMLLVALALWRSLPDAPATAARTSYLATLRSLGGLLVRLPRLRSTALMGGISFGAVSVLFSTMALLLAGPGHGLSDMAIGLVGLAGVAGALMANVAGRLADRGWGQTTMRTSAVLLVLGWGMLWLGRDSLAWFLAGVLMIDLALQGIHISSQHVIYRLLPEARSRINAVYMTCYFGGAALGSALGSLAWQHGGWQAVCLTGAGIGCLNFFALWLDARYARGSTPSA
ncbi:MAG: putative transporter [Kerstersia gyiorum]